MIISKVRRAENDDLEAGDMILQFGHLLGRNGVRQEFHGKSSKTWL